ncbi:hypothetical protein PhiBTCVTUL1a_25 [Burkholderia phage phiBtTUL1a]|nr:hypothetical protein PhiBTCVTUL1a_25 [Burkholderia phage phiBtTUL1a]
MNFEAVFIGISGKKWRGARTGRPAERPRLSERKSRARRAGFRNAKLIAWNLASKFVSYQVERRDAVCSSASSRSSACAHSKRNRATATAAPTQTLSMFMSVLARVLVAELVADRAGAGSAAECSIVPTADVLADHLSFHRVSGLGRFQVSLRTSRTPTAIRCCAISRIRCSTRAPRGMRRSSSRFFAGWLTIYLLDLESDRTQEQASVVVELHASCMSHGMRPADVLAVPMR